MIFFRADGNSQIGVGHIMRCLSIAEAARNMGEECIFVTASDEMLSVIKGKSFNTIVLNSNYKDMESENVLWLLKDYANPVVVVDSYYASEGYLKSLRAYCRNNGGKLIYIDDIKKFAYPCDVLINYQIHGTEAEYKKIYGEKEQPQYAVGTEYVPLRNEFLPLPERKVNRQANNILITTGGSDPEHLAIELVRIAKKSGKFFHFVIGAVNGDRYLIEHEAENCPNITLHINATNMSELMNSCDVAISAAGSTLYELCATQTPTITFVVADNQIPIAEGFATKGIMYNCGDARNLGAPKLAEILMNEAIMLCENYDRRISYSKQMKTVVDGKGTERVLDVIMSK